MIITALAASLSLAPCPAGAHCLEDETLLAVSANPDRAAFILSAMQTAQARYGDVFSRTPGLTAVIEDSTQFPGLALELDAQGYTVKPWVSPQAMRDQLEAQLRPALEAQMAGAPEAVIDAAINSALSDRVDGNERVRHGEAIIAHELGHLWLRDTYDWPDIDTGGARTYGAAAAPDWFDETAAVLMESEQLTGERRSNLYEDLPDDISAQLSRYFTMEHPLLQMAALAADRAAAAARARGEAADGPQIMLFNPETTLAILAGFAHNRRVMVTGFHGTGKSTHIEQVAARLNWPLIRVNLDSHISRIDLVGKDAIVIKDGKQITEFREGILPWAYSTTSHWCSTNTTPAALT
jgi:hypothetical protein